MKIYIDADACPVKDVVIEEALKRKIDVVIVTSIAHFSTVIQPAGVETIYVDTGAESADYRLVQLIKAHDILITQDYGLASLGLGKKCIVLHHSGFQYSNENIDQLLQSRYLSAMVRKSGKRTKGPKPFTDEDRAKFRTLLIHTLEQEHV